MTTIQEIRDALKAYEDEGPVYRAVSDEAKQFRWRSPDYIRTMLAALDTKSTEISSDLVARATKAEQERDQLRAEVATLKQSYSEAFASIGRMERDALRADLKWLDEKCHAINCADGKSCVTRADDGKEFFGETFSEAIRAARTSDPLLNKPVITEL